jgi:hypothetical protein
MESVPRNVILDLLPAYLAGDASEESRAMVEEFARHDPEIARLIRAGTLEPGAIANVTLPDDLEMKAMKRIRRGIRRRMVYVALATAALLTIPLVARFPWSLGDFIVMGVLLFGTGLAYVLIAGLSDSIAYRAAVGLAVAAGFLLIWVNLAVGIIGSEDNPANQLYAGVLLVGFVGAAFARLRPWGMSLALYATAIAQMLVPVIALIVWPATFGEHPGIVSVFLLNAFFAALFVVSAVLFRQAGDTTQKTKR